MRLERTVFVILSTVAVGVIALLSAALLIAGPASAQSAAAPTCSSSAVPDPANNPGLVSDCNILLQARDTLAGDATLNWSADRPIEEWEGVTVGGTPERVEVLDITHTALTGTIPSELGSLTNLEALYLRGNQLSGDIPVELADLANLWSLELNSNRLTGEIPVELGNLTNLSW